MKRWSNRSASAAQQGPSILLPPAGDCGRTTANVSYIGRSWASPLVRQIQQMRRRPAGSGAIDAIPRCRRCRHRSIRGAAVAVYVGGLLSLACLHVAFLWNQRASRAAVPVPQAADEAVRLTLRQEQEPGERDVHDAAQRHLEVTEARAAHPRPASTETDDPFALTSSVDMLQYTVRINTWKRPEQLRVAVRHYLTCPRVAQVQVVWCTAQGPPPDWLQELNQGQSQRVVLEMHDANSLNERFNVLVEPATRGVLSVDDDVLRPCLALDAGFAKWRSHPKRLVGYDARTITMESDEDGKQRWKYGYLSTTKQTNEYALSLSRFAFVHVEHLRGYMTRMPAAIRDTVEHHLNCEDIALSLWISSQTGAKVPLLADGWAMRSLAKLPRLGGDSGAAISATAGHKRIRDDCVNTFADLLGLKDRLRPARWVHAQDPLSASGADDEPGRGAGRRDQAPQPRLEALESFMSGMRRMKKKEVAIQIKTLMRDMLKPAMAGGLLPDGDAPEEAPAAAEN